MLYLIKNSKIIYRRPHGVKIDFIMIWLMRKICFFLRASVPYLVATMD